MIMVFLLALVLMLVSCNEACRLWTVHNSPSGECQCGASQSVHCERDNMRISLLKCYCMPYNRDFNPTVVGPCNAMCRRAGADYNYYGVLNLSDDVTLLNSELLRMQCSEKASM